jgi:aminoglycoside phosphotransferase (APT) family kinase protein
MTTTIGKEAAAARKARAVAAAVRAARELDLVIDEPVILHDGFSVVVHLAPSPVVVRVPVVLPVAVDLATQSARQTRELRAVAWLAASGFPVVRPSALVPPAPVVRDGFSMTFWEKVEVDTTKAPDWVGNAARVAELHRALRGCPVDLPFLSPVAIMVPACLEHLARNPELIDSADLEKAQAEWAAVRPVLTSRAAFEARFPNATVQAVHGDAPAYNLIETTSGTRHADFEDVTLGTPEWDLAGFGPEVQGAYDAAASELGLPKLDPAVLRVMEAGRSLQLVACLALAPEYPGLAEGIGPMIDAWRATPFSFDRS